MLQKAAATTRDGVFVNPLVGKKKPGDFTDVNRQSIRGYD